jgi:hypothetical protein
MSSAIAVILALTLSAEPVARAAEPRRVPRAGILITASIGLGLIGVGAGYDLYGRSVTAPDAPVAPGTAWAGEGYFVGGVSLIVTGLCFVLIAALLTHWYSPKSILGVQW